MRPDKELQEGVVKALDWEPSVNAAQIGVTVQRGVVTMTGQVGTLREKWIAEKAARHVWGVRAIANDLAVAPDGASMRSDTAIAGAAVNALSWNSAIPPDLIQITVRDGWVTLNGTVPWQYQKAAAEKAIAHLYGVKGVVNSIAVNAPVTAANVRQKIEEAFKRSADIDAKHVSVDAHNGTVVLKGTVHSLSERRAAEYAAWAAPGVIAVDDQLVIAP
jgi:osmotically-inducible protein OsmY